MSWPGYFEFDGKEIVNVPRAAAYARSRGAYWAIDDSVSAGVDLAALLGDAPYSSVDGGSSYDFGSDTDGVPYILDGAGSIAYDTDSTPYLTSSAGLDDGVGYDTDGVPYVLESGAEAPWYSPDDPESLDFLGVIPGENGISGIEDSTRSAAITQFTDIGGFSSPAHDDTKGVVFDLLLLATSEAGVSYGFEWLKSVTSLRDCQGRRKGMFGAELRFADSIPLPDNFPGMARTAYWNRISRRLRRVKNTDGPVVTGKTVRYQGNCTVSIWRVTMTLTADDPMVYGIAVPVVDDLGGTGDPYVPGFTGDFENTPVLHTDGSCPEPVYTPVFDPNCPPLIAPPDPPDVPLSCVATPANWERRWVEIPASVVPKFGEGRPVVRITAGGADVRNIRLRWFETEEFLEDPTCGHFAAQLVTYIPASSVLTIDGVAAASYIDQGSVRRRCDSLTLGEYARPIWWFGLSCDRSYTVAMDVPADTPPVKIEISMTGRSS